MDVAGGGMERTGSETESWLPTSARTARSRIRNGSRRGMAGAGYARDMAWGAAWGLGWGPFYLRARRVRRQKQLTLVELTLDTFLMHTCEVGCSAGSLERPRLPFSYVPLGSPPGLTKVSECRSSQYRKHCQGFGARSFGNTALEIDC